MSDGPSPAVILRRGWGLVRSQPAIFALLSIWAFAPLGALLVYVARHGGVLTGAYGSDSFDQLAYLGWIRDEGAHGLASNLWQVGATPHDYLHPLYFISGLLWRLGASVQLVYVVWQPVAVLVLFLGSAAYVRRLLPGGRGRQSAALSLGLFYLTPVLALAVWTGRVSAGHRFALVLSTDDADSALNLWGFDHTAIAIGLMPVFLIAIEKLLARAGPEVRGAGRARSWTRGWTAIASLAGMLVSWLHPWQGLTLLGILGGMIALRGPRRRYLAFAVPALATLLPLIYGTVLSRTDPSWITFQANTIGVGPAPWWALAASFGPLAALGALGVRRPREDRDWLLLLWVAACAGVYFLIPEFPPHALSGITLPLAVLAVRGWPRLIALARVPRRVAGLIAVAAILAVTVPGALYHLQSSRDDLADPSHAAARALLVLRPGQAAALSYLSAAPRRGGVLAPLLLSMSVPGLTGRAAYAGHFMWQPRVNVATADAFFDPGLKDPDGSKRRAILKQSRAAFVIADCGAPAPLAAAIAPLARQVRRFGCVTVYETRLPLPAAPGR